MSRKTRRSKKKTHSRRKQRTYRRHRGGEGIFSFSGRTISENEFKNLVESGKLSEFANALD